MKKLVIFILVLVLLIVAEYYFLNEVFSQRRFGVILVTLVTIFFCVFALMRFFKKSVLSSD